VAIRRRPASNGAHYLCASDDKELRRKPGLFVRVLGPCSKFAPNAANGFVIAPAGP
jgi:hypothetical protein